MIMQKRIEAESVHWWTGEAYGFSSVQPHKGGRIDGIICQMARLRLNNLAL